MLEFEVRSFYRALSFPASFLFPWKSMWRINAPLRVLYMDGDTREGLDCG
jgi:hypothetical protein